MATQLTVKQQLNQHIAHPEVFGPGTWRCIHLLAYKAESYAENLQAALSIKLIIDNIPCLDPCRKHALAYWAKDPATNHLSESRGVFWWSVDFHNTVNARLNQEHPEKPAKPILTRVQALELYDPNMFCTSDCDSKVATPIASPMPVMATPITLVNKPSYPPAQIGTTPESQGYSVTPHYNIVIRPVSPLRNQRPPPSKTGNGWW